MMNLKEISRSELVEKYILEEIVAGLKPGDRIPSERELAKVVSVSVPTVNKILVSLTDRGILFRRKGLGTYVSEPSLKEKVVRVITQSPGTYDPQETVNWFNYQFVLEGFSRKAREYGIIAETFFFDQYQPVTPELMRELLLPGADGYLFHMVLKSDWEWARELMRAGKTVVARSYAPSEICHTVYAGMKESYVAALRCLLNQGRGNIVFFHSPVHQDGYSEQHWKEFRAAAEEVGVDIPAERFRTAGLSAREGYSAAEKMIREGVKFDAVLAGTDTRAFGIMQALKDAGMRIPEDVEIVGADDLPQCMKQVPPLSTITYPMYEIGAALCEIFVEVSRGNGTSIINREVKRKFIRRESCGKTE